MTSRPAACIRMTLLCFGALNVALVDAATGPLQATTATGTTRALVGHNVTFELSDEWTRYRTVSRGASTTDTYVKTTAVGDFSCRVLLTAYGTVRRRVPAAPAKAITTADGRITINSRGRTNTTRWYLGTSETGPAAAAIAAIPARLRASNRKAVFIQMTLRPEDPGADDACGTAVAADRADLEAAIKSSRAA